MLGSEHALTFLFTCSRRNLFREAVQHHHKIASITAMMTKLTALVVLLSLSWGPTSVVSQLCEANCESGECVFNVNVNLTEGQLGETKRSPAWQCTVVLWRNL